MSVETLPLFPLSAVLLPGASMGLRVFEARYLDLVRECGRSGRTFGICLILEGHEAGRPAVPAAIGTEALIEDFDSDGDGLLTLKVRGGRRFRAQRLRVRDNGLQVAEVQWFQPEGPKRVVPEHSALVTVLQHALDRTGGEHAGVSGARLEDAEWVSWRLAELLPLSATQRQMLLQIEEAYERMEQLLILAG